MAEPIRHGHSISIIGAWNQRIFNPIWIAQNVAKAKEVMIAIAPADPSLPIRLQFDGIFLHAGADRILLNPVQLNDPSLERLQSVAIRILELLHHTPIAAVGVNVQFVEKSPTGPLLDAFTLADNNVLSDFGANIVATTIRRTLVLGERKLNLILDQKKDGSVSVEFNYHQDVKSALEASKHIAHGFLAYRDAATAFMNDVYSAEIANAYA